LNLDDDLMRAAKRRAVETGRTLTSMIEAALRDLLRQRSPTGPAYRLRWTTVRGGVQPGVDLTDRDTLYDRMEGRS